MMAYEPMQVAACRMVLLEVLQLLEPWREHFVVIGGWATHMLLHDSPNAQAMPDYVGTMDVDLSICLGPASVRAIRGELLSAGYREDNSMPSRLLRTVQVSGSPYHVPVDLLAASSREYRNRVAGGISFALSGTLPDGHETTLQVPIVSMADLLVMKMRPYREKNEKAKDGYDVYYLLRYAAGSPERAAGQVAARLPADLRSELCDNLQLFFLQKKRAARDAAIMIRDFHSTPKAQALRDVEEVVRRFVAELCE